MEYKYITREAVEYVDEVMSIAEVFFKTYKIKKNDQNLLLVVSLLANASSMQNLLGNVENCQDGNVNINLGK